MIVRVSAKKSNSDKSHFYNSDKIHLLYAYFIEIVFINIRGVDLKRLIMRNYFYLDQQEKTRQTNEMNLADGRKGGTDKQDETKG